MSSFYHMFSCVIAWCRDLQVVFSLHYRRAKYFYSWKRTKETSQSFDDKSRSIFGLQYLVYNENWLITMSCTASSVRSVKGTSEIFDFCPFCLKISINFYLEYHKSNVPNNTELLLYNMTFYFISWMSKDIINGILGSFYSIL